MEPVSDVTLDQCRAAARLVTAWGDAGGFIAVDVARAADTYRAMLEDETMTKVLTFPAAPISTGLRGVIRELVAEGHVDAIITTCGTLDHDIARTVGDYMQGSFDLDDEDVYDQGYHRLGSVLVPLDAYGPTVEAFMTPVLDGMAEGFTAADLTRAIGEELAGRERGGESLLAACARADVPVFVPALVDGSVGSQVWSWWERTGRQPDMMGDQRALFDLVTDATRMGALMIGGGVSKHHAIWWAQFREGLDSAVYITTAPERDGSLSGARLTEAVSWGKLKAQAAQITVEGEATVLLPLIVGAAVSDLGQ